MTGFYTGVGSRETPPEVLAYMTAVAAFLRAGGWTLRSGGADGADTAFERGASGAAEVYLPWGRFNSNPSPLFPPSDAARALDAATHPAWSRCGGGARSLHARNAHQVVGRDVNVPVPSAFLLCWTPDGAQTASECTAATGGTAMAIRIAERYGVPAFNLQRGDADARAFVDRLHGLVAA